MIDFEFAEGLVNNKFTSHNNYVFSQVTETNLRFFRETPNYPIIMMSAWQSDKTHLMYSANMSQLRGRLVNTAKIKEILNSAPMPIVIRLKGRYYLMGKGFLAHVEDFDEFGDTFKLLYVACKDNTKPFSFRLEDVKMFVSKHIHSERYKSVFPAIKDIIALHPGDVIYTNNLDKRIGDHIPFPTGGTLTERINYKKAVVMETIRDYFSPSPW